MEELLLQQGNQHYKKLNAVDAYSTLSQALVIGYCWIYRQCISRLPARLEVSSEKIGLRNFLCSQN